VAVVQQYNRQVTQITHKAQTQYKTTTINDTITANTYTIHPVATNTTKLQQIQQQKHLLNHQFSLHFASLRYTSLHFPHFTLLNPLHSTSDFQKEILGRTL
jgi:hypothetical protein